MKMKIICEECGGEDFKSLTSSLSFKYGSTITDSCYKCTNCGAWYTVVPIGISVLINQIMCFLIPLGFWVRFFIEYPNPNTTIIECILGVVSGTALGYGLLTWSWNYLKAFAGAVPLEYWAIHIDETYHLYQRENETADYKIITTSVTVYGAKNFFELAVYRINTGLENGAVKMLDIDIMEDHIEMMMMNVNLKKMIIDGSDVVIHDLKGKEMCKGKIYKVQPEPEELT